MAEKKTAKVTAAPTPEIDPATGLPKLPENHAFSVTVGARGVDPSVRIVRLEKPQYSPWMPRSYYHAHELAEYDARPDTEHRTEEVKTSQYVPPGLFRSAKNVPGVRVETQIRYLEPPRQIVIHIEFFTTPTLKANLLERAVLTYNNSLIKIESQEVAGLYPPKKHEA